MKNTQGAPPGGVEEAVEIYGDMLYRLCLVNLGSPADAEDALQETMVKYLQKAPPFESEGHRKGWLITVALNCCRDIHRRRKRCPVAEMNGVEQSAQPPPDSGIIDALMTLPEKFRTALTLHYVEGYSVEEIARATGKTVSAIKMRLMKGRALLREAYGKENM